MPSRPRGSFTSGSSQPGRSKGTSRSLAKRTLERSPSARGSARSRSPTTIGRSGSDLVAAMNRAARRSTLVPAVEDSAKWRLEPATHGIDGFLGGMVGTLVTAMADGSWSRVKACGNDACQWLFFDQSRNHSGTWCSMAECGSRMKARAYRARRRAEHAAS